jgi:hypothetical protein
LFHKLREEDDVSFTRGHTAVGESDHAVGQVHAVLGAFVTEELQDLEDLLEVERLLRVDDVHRLGNVELVELATSQGQVFGGVETATVLKRKRRRRRRKKRKTKDKKEDEREKQEKATKQTNGHTFFNKTQTSRPNLRKSAMTAPLLSCSTPFLWNSFTMALDS